MFWYWVSCIGCNSCSDSKQYRLADATNEGTRARTHTHTQNTHTHIVCGARTYSFPETTHNFATSQLFCPPCNPHSPPSSYANCVTRSSSGSTPLTAMALNKHTPLRGMMLMALAISSNKPHTHTHTSSHATRSNKSGCSLLPIHQASSSPLLLDPPPTHIRTTPPPPQTPPPPYGMPAAMRLKGSVCGHAVFVDDGRAMLVKTKRERESLSGTR